MFRKMVLKSLTGIAIAGIAVCLIAFAVPVPFEWDEGGDYTGPIDVPQCEAPGLAVETCDAAVLDYSNLSDGYIMVKSLTPRKVRIVVTNPQGFEDNRWEINETNRFFSVTLTSGSGAYDIRVMEHLEGARYVEALRISLSFDDSNADKLYLYPFILANFDAESEAVKKSFDLCLNAASDLEKVQSIYGYITENIRYDDSFVALDNYTPDCDRTLRTQKGICYDYAALMTVMLRAQGIQTKLVIGYANSEYHAWNEVFIPWSCPRGLYQAQS